MTRAHVAAFRAALIVFLISTFAAGDVLAQPSTWGGEKRRGRKYKVRIDSAPQQAAIYLEDESYGIVGYTPWDGRLAKGTWKVILKKDGYELTTRTIDVRRRRSTQETFVPMAKMDVPATIEIRGDADQNAFGAEVSIDGQVIGTIPLSSEVPDGRHLIEIKKEGYESFSQWIDVTEGQKATVNPVLKAIAEPKGMGNILVQADVTGAEVLIDGVAHTDTTPTVISGVVAGPHVIEVRKEGVPPWRQTVDVIAGETIKVTADWASEPTGGTIRVLSDVQGATVRIDGAEVGPAPVEIKDVAAGEHIIEVRADGYEPKTDRIQVSAGASMVVELNFGSGGPTGLLRVVSPVPEAEVFIDGEKIGLVPQQRALTAGTHYVVVQKDGHQKFQRTITIIEGQTETVTAELVAAGSIRFISNPAGADVFVDGERIGQTPMESSDIPVGEHVIAIRMAGYYDFEQSVSVEGGQTKVINGAMKTLERAPTPAELERQQRGLTSYGARTMPRGRSTVDFGVGYPYYIDGRITIGAGKLADRFGFDAGVLVRSYFTRTEIGLTGRLNLIDADPFSLGTFTQLGGGGTFFDDSNRNSFFWDLGAAASLTGLGAVTITGRTYLNFFTDRHCPKADVAAGAYDDNDANGVDTCDEILMGTATPEKMARVSQLVGSGAGDAFGRDNGVRFMTSLFIEVAVRQQFNVWFLLEGAPFQSERAAFTNLFSGTQFEDDPLTYFRLGMTYKF